MSEQKERSNPILYLFFLGLAAYLVWRAFSLGFDKGDYAGRYEPPLETRPPQAEKRPADLRKLRIPTPEQVAQGQELFAINCAPCHGLAGEGNGPKAAGLNPPPRNFTKEKFKFGASPLQIFNTVSKGSLGTSMAAFDFLREEERMALAHFVRTRVPNPPEDPKELVDTLPVVAGETVPPVKTPSVPGDTSARKDTTAGKDANAKHFELPIGFAEARLVEESRSQAGAAPAGFQAGPVFAAHCAACHGSQGEGSVVQREFPATGVIYLRTAPLKIVKKGLLESREAFIRFMSASLPALADHRFPDLTAAEMAELFKTLQVISTQGN